MGLEWRGPHVTIPVCLLHYVWIPKLNVYRDGSYQAPQVPPYYGTPQTKPGVTKNDRENNFTRTIWTGYSAEYLKCKTIQGIGQYIRQNIIEVLWWVVSTTTQECNCFDKHHNMNIQFNILNVTSQTVFLGFLCDIEAGDLPCFVDKFTVELENP